MRDTSVGESLEEAGAGDNCHSAAMQLMLKNEKSFTAILARKNVAVSDDGQITLPKLNNIIPYEAIKSPKDVVGKGDAGIKTYQATIKTAEAGVAGTIKDLKSLLDILGVKELKVKGMVGGTAYAPGGKFYNADWTDGWMKIAEKRAQSLLKALGLAEKPGISVEGEFGKTIGVEISVTSLMRISMMKSVSSVKEDCGGESSGTNVGNLATPEAVLDAAKEILQRGHIGYSSDGSIALKDPAFSDNIIPFKRCEGKSGMAKDKRFLECVTEVEISSHVDKAKEAMKDLADLARIAGVTSFEVTGYTKTTPASPAEKLAAQKLGAARARELVRLLNEVSGGTPLVRFSGKLYDEMTACMKSTAAGKCDSVSKFGQIAVEIHFEALLNPMALGN